MALDWLLPVAAMLTATLLVYAVYLLVTPQASLRERLTAYPSGAAPSAVATVVTPVGLPLKDRSLSGIATLDRYLRGTSYAQRLELDLARAALPMRVGEYLLLRWLGAVVTYLVVTMVFRVFWPLALVLGALAFLAPRLWLSGREQKRVRAVEDQLVDALTMMANSLKAGASFLQAMEMVATELPPPVSTEFRQVVAEIGVGAPVEQALTDLTERVRSYDLYLIVTAIVVQRRVGGNLAEVMSNIAHTIRERQQLLRQAVVETSEMRLSAYVLIALPIGMFIYLLVTRPGYLQPMLEEGVGRLMMAAAVVMQLVGYWVMRRIADIKV
ncbi:MAG: type II secretion system F family protein [Chloroflexota bacterium]